ncbi:MAG: glycosyltransferase family 9 protein [Candidatus Taylorbacteria bacterium]
MKILVLCLPGIGDALMATPMIKSLRQNNPEAIIDVVCMFGAVEYVFKSNPNVNNVYRLSIYNANKFSGLREILSLRKKKYDISILAFPAFRREYHIVHWLLGAKKRIAHKFDKGFWSELHFLNKDLVVVDETEHNVTNNMNLLKALGFDWQKEVSRDQIKYDLILDEKDITFGRKYIEELGWKFGDIVGIHPGSTNSPTSILRRWPIERYAEVARFLIKEKQKKVLIFAGSDEKDLGHRLFELIGDPTSCRLVDGIGFGNMLGVLDNISLLLCNDSGLGHIAVSRGKKIVAVFAPTNDKWSLPYGHNLVSLIRPKDFQPWYRYDLKRKVPSGVEGGADKISVSQVIDVTSQIL